MYDIYIYKLLFQDDFYLVISCYSCFCPFFQAQQKRLVFPPNKKRTNNAAPPGRSHLQPRKTHRFLQVVHLEYEAYEPMALKDDGEPSASGDVKVSNWDWW